MDLKEIQHLAELSKLEFSQTELEAFASDFASLVSLADNIKNADVKGKRVLQSIKLGDLRKDETKKSLPCKVILANAPLAKKDSFVVPRVVE